MVKQLALPGLEHRATHVAPDAPVLFDDVDAHADGEPPAAAPLEGQLALFDDYAQLRRDLYDALEAGRFEQALELRSRLDDEYDDADTGPFAFLDGLVGPLWERSPRDVIALAREIAQEPDLPSALAESVPGAVVARLVGQHGADAVLADVPDALPLVFRALSRDAGDADRRAPARRLVRDALLAGHSLEPLDFHDPAVRDLLAEDLSPAWLACLGVVRRLWTAARPDGEADAGGPADLDDDDARAAAFWRCLQVTEDHAAAQAAVHEARKRMKRLNPELHAAYLRRLV